MGLRHVGRRPGSRVTFGVPLPPRPSPPRPEPRRLELAEELVGVEAPAAVSDTEPSAAPAPASASAPPVNPTLREIYALIDQRLSPAIINRISTIPPAPEHEPTKPGPKSSIRAAAKSTTAATKIGMAVIGAAVVAAEFIADHYPHLEGPLKALFKVGLRLLGDGGSP